MAERGATMGRSAVFGFCLLVSVMSGSAFGLSDFVTFESVAVKPLALSPDGSRLYAVNTPDNTLEIFDVHGGGSTGPAPCPCSTRFARRTPGTHWAAECSGK